MNRIVSLQVAHWSRPLRETMAISRGGFGERHHIFVKCITDAGHVGYGEAVGDWRRILAALRFGIDWKPLLGHPVLTPQSVWELLLDGDVYYEALGTMWAATSAVEMALADVLAKENGKSAAMTSGLGTNLEPLYSYASNVYWDSPERMANVARRIMERGIRSVKVHVGVKSPTEEVPRLRAVRDAIGPETPLMVDLNCGYSADQAIEAALIWEHLNIAWLEEPVRPFDWEGLSSVASSVSIPVAVGENLGWLSDFERAVDCGARVLMPDAGRIGMRNCQSIDELCANHRLTYSPHNYSSGILLGATVTLLSSSSAPGPLEIDMSSNSLYEDLWGPLEFDNEGRLVIADRRAFGLLPESAADVLDRLPWTEIGITDMLDQ